MGGIALFDRAGQLSALGEGLTSAAAGEGRVVLLEAGLGLGKTSLVDALTLRAQEQDFTVLAARGIELELDLSFGVARQLLEGVAPGVASGPAAAVFSREADAKPREPGLSAVVPSLYWMIAELAERGPVLMTIDDAHVADRASLRFVAYLAARAAQLPVLIVLAARPSEPGAWSRVRETILAQGNASMVEPGILGEQAVGELLAQRLGQAIEPDLVSVSREATGGNPLLVVELARAFGQLGLPRTAEAVRDLAPRAVSRAVLGRLGRLSDDAIALARAASLFPEGVELRHAAALAGLDIDEAGAAADVLARLEILGSDRPLRFVHPAIRGALEADQPAGWKGSGHRRAATLLEAEGADPERIAGHLLHAEPAGDPAVARALTTAASRAVAKGAAEAAIRYLERALEEPVAPSERPAVLWELGRMHLRLGEPGASVPLAQAHADWVGAPPPDLVTDLARSYAFSWNTPAAIELLEGSLGGDVVPAGHRVRLGAELLWHLFTGQRRAETSRWLAELPQDMAGESTAECVILSFQAAASCDRCEPAAIGLELARRAFSDHLLGDDPGAPAVALTLGALRTCGGFAEAIACTRRVEAMAVELGADAVVQYAAAERAELQLMTGALEDAEADARFSLELSERIGDRFVIYHLSVRALAKVLVARGALDEARAQIAAAGDPPAHFTGDMLRHARAVVSIASGDDAAAEADLTHLAGQCRESGIANPGYWPRPDFELAPLWRRQGRDEEAVAMADAALGQARAFGSAWVLGAALHARALAGDGTDALELLQESVAALRDSEARLLLATALVDLGAALRRSGQRAAAREPLREALSMAHGFSAKPLADRAAAELRLAGGRVHRPTTSGPEGLTAAERRVARLAADGLTNAEVARHLFLSIKTVESHLRAVFRKLEVSARRDLAPALDGEAQGMARTGPV